MLITFDLNAKSSRSKMGETIETFLKNGKAVDDYVEIMKDVNPLDPNFQKSFSRYYALNASFGMNKGNFYNIFDVYYNHKYDKQGGCKQVNYRNILCDLKGNSGTGRCEISFGSKLLHTIDCDEPIIDSQVVENLRECPYTAKYFLGVPKTIEGIDKAVDLHNALKACYYDCLIPCAKSVGYFDAFDNAFPCAKNISEVKKIDFYIWAM